MKERFKQWLLSQNELIGTNAKYIVARLGENLKESSHATNVIGQCRKKMQ